MYRDVAAGVLMVKIAAAADEAKAVVLDLTDPLWPGRHRAAVGRQAGLNEATEGCRRFVMLCGRVREAEQLQWNAEGPTNPFSR